MSFIIIGAGISGLYTAYSLHKKLGISDMIILEKTNRIGGRINTKYVNDVFLEMGAGGISSCHTNMLNLVRELGLGDKLVSGRGGRSYVKLLTLPTSQKKLPSIYRIESIIEISSTDFYDIISDLTGRLNEDHFFEMALTYNLYSLIEKLYGVDKADQLMYQFGYRTDFIEQNAVEALQMFKNSFAKDAKFYRLDGGLIQIIDRLNDYLVSNNVRIKINSECVNIIRENGTYVCELKNGGKIYGHNIIFAIPKSNIFQIKYLEKIRHELDSVASKPLARIYAFFPQNIGGKVWFDDITTALTTKTILNQIIPINPSKGLIMIYCDGINADMWNIFYKNNTIKKELIFHLTKIFSHKIIPEPDEIYFSYYENATHIWKPGVNPYKMYKYIARPFKEENIFIVGEAYSLVQQWSEGALQSVNNLLNILEHQNINI